LLQNLPIILSLRNKVQKVFALGHKKPIKNNFALGNEAVKHHPSEKDML